MDIHNVIDIHDNGEFVSVETKTGSVIHLPMKSKHSITILDMECPSDEYQIDIGVDLYQ